MVLWLVGCWLVIGGWDLAPSSSSDVAYLPYLTFVWEIFSHCFIHLLYSPLCCDSSYSLPLLSLQRTLCVLHYLRVADVQEIHGWPTGGVTLHTSGVHPAEHVGMVFLLALLYAPSKSLMDEQYNHATTRGPDDRC